jgi:hypothetical protein
MVYFILSIPIEMPELVGAPAENLVLALLKVRCSCCHDIYASIYEQATNGVHECCLPRLSRSVLARHEETTIILYLLRLIHGGKETCACGDIPLC